MSVVRVGITAVFLLIAVPRGQGAVVVRGETGTSARRLKAVDKLLADKQWGEAIDELRRILDEAGDELAPVHARWSVRVRRLCHQRLAALQPAELQLYRGKVDAQARKWLSQGEADHDERLLRRVVDEAFCSRSGDQALDLLGDLAFERGDFDAAEHWWRLIALPIEPGVAKPSIDELVYPDPQVDVARVRAKQLLVQLFRGERDQCKEALKAFRAAHPKAEGTFAGRKGVYADILDKLAAEEPARAVEEWATYGGAPSRNRVVREVPGRPNWRVPRPLPAWTRRFDGIVLIRAVEAAPLGRARELAFHPLILDNRVFIADARYVRAFDLISGEPTVWFDLVNDGKNGGLDLPMQLPAHADLNFTLSADSQRLFARLGVPTLGSVVVRQPGIANPAPAPSDTFLVCLDRHQPHRVVWSEKSNHTETSAEMFEGSPVVHAGRAYIGLTRFEGASAVRSIACYDAATGAPRWRQPVEVCEVQHLKVPEPRWQRWLLTLAGTQVVYCTNAGAVVALDAVTGRRAWAVRYPSRGARTEDGRPSPRSVTPPVYANGRLFVAPLDFGRILCLDPDTGKTLWQSEPAVETVDLLGVTHGKLIVTTPDDIRALTTDTGQTLRRWIFPSDGIRLPSFGRGLLAANWVYWPTVNGLRVLDQETGDVVGDPAAPFNYVPIRGNLAAANGCLVVADTEKLYAFVPPRYHLEERRRQSRAAPESAAARWQLALAEADAGQYEAALASLAALKRPVLGRRLRQEVMLEQAAAAAREGRWDDAATILGQVAAMDLPLPERAHGVARTARLWLDAGRPERAVAAWHDFHARCTNSSDGKTALPRTAPALAEHAARQIDALIAAHGASVYQPIEQRARDLLATAQGKRRQAVLEQVVREYPRASAGDSACRQLIALHEQAERFGSAAHFMRLLPQRPLAPADDAALQCRLAQAYEKERCWSAARAVWHRLTKLHGAVVVPSLSERPLRDFIADRLQKSADYRRLDEPTSMGPALPLFRAWEMTLDAVEEQLLPAEGGEGALEFFLTGAKGTEGVLRCREAASGKVRWQQRLPKSPEWLGRHADLVLAASSEGVHGLSLADGAIQWSWAGEMEKPPLLSGFRLADGRLFCFDDDRRVMAFDAGTGRVPWTRWAPAARMHPLEPGGRFWPAYHADARRLVLQVAGGQTWIIAADTGRILHTLATSADPWPRAPHIIDEHRIGLVPDDRRVRLLDLDTGKVVWEHTTRKPSLSGSAPRIRGDADGLFVLSDDWIVERVDVRSGTPIWEKGNRHWISRTLPAGWSAVHDARAAYFSAHNLLHARALADGKVLWDQLLPEEIGAWQIVRVRDYLLVYPAGSAPQSLAPRLLGGYLLGFPELSPLRRFPVLILDAQDGQRIQQLNFVTDGRGAGVHPWDGGVAVMASGKVWGAAPRGR